MFGLQKCRLKSRRQTGLAATRLPTCPKCQQLQNAAGETACPTKKSSRQEIFADFSTILVPYASMPLKFNHPVRRSIVIIAAAGLLAWAGRELLRNRPVSAASAGPSFVEF